MKALRAAVLTGKITWRTLCLRRANRRYRRAQWRLWQSRWAGMELDVTMAFIDSGPPSETLPEHHDRMVRWLAATQRAVDTVPAAARAEEAVRRAAVRRRESPESGPQGG